jgi:hypothetical protein
MKKLIFIATIIVIMFASCTKDNNTEISLTDQEKSDLIFLRQEEKLAHDVYVYAYAKYGINIFNNISNSEVTHIDAVLTLMNKYNINDPAAGMAVGVFENDELQLLYQQLISKVNLSLVQALEAGATIEDLDIRDIISLYKNTTKTDLIQVYDMLTCGSRNHLRGFTGQLKTLNSTYSPQFLSVSEYQTILSGNHEQCGK